MKENYKINTLEHRGKAFLSSHFFKWKSHLWNAGTGKLKNWLNVKHLIVIRCKSERYLYYTSCPGTLNGTYGTSGWRAWMWKHRYSSLSRKTMKSNLLIKWSWKLTAHQIWSRNVPSFSNCWLVTETSTCLQLLVIWYPLGLNPLQRTNPCLPKEKETKRNWKIVSGLLVVAAFLAGIIKGQKCVAVLST